MSPKARFSLLTLAAIVGVAGTLWLGRWQLSRATEKETLQASIDSRGALPPIDGASLVGAGDGASLYYRSVQLKGRWIAERTVFLDNRQMRAQPGFFVVTPLELLDSHTIVLVQRGWLQRNFIDRAALPRVATPPGIVEVRGQVAPPPSRLYAFKGEDRGPIRQNLEVAAFAAETGLKLFGGSVRQTGRDDSNLLRDWPVPGTGVDKHYGYAFQWFALSALLTGLYVWFQFFRRATGTRGSSRV